MDHTKMEAARVEKSENREVDCRNDVKGKVLKLDEDIMQKMDILSKVEDEYIKLISEISSDKLEVERKNAEFMKMMDGKLHQCKEKTSLIHKIREEFHVAMKEP